MWQKFVRYSMLVLFAVYSIILLSAGSFFQSHQTLSYLYFFMILYLISPILSAVMYFYRTTPEKSIVILNEGDIDLGFEHNATSAKIGLDQIKQVLIQKTYIRFTLKTTAYDSYIYLFKDEAIDNDFASLQAECQTLQTKIG